MGMAFTNRMRQTFSRFPCAGHYFSELKINGQELKINEQEIKKHRCINHPSFTGKGCMSHL